MAYLPPGTWIMYEGRLARIAAADKAINDQRTCWLRWMKPDGSVVRRKVMESEVTEAVSDQIPQDLREKSNEARKTHTTMNKQSRYRRLQEAR